MKYFVLLTNIGAAKLANATVLGSHLDITHMAVGDGGGTLPTPNPAQTALINEKRRAGINTLSVDPVNTNQIIAEQVIPENEGGFWIREIGLFDADGDMVAIGNCAETYKPLLQEGSGRIQTVRMILIVSSTDAVTLKIDPAVVLATRGYVDNVIDAHEKNRKHPDGTLNAKGFVQLSSATTSDSEVLAATPKAVKAANDNANSRVPSDRKVNGKALSADIALNAGDVGAYTKAETDTRVTAATTAANNAATAATNATTAANNAATAATNANTNANGRVPSGRTVNGKALSADIALNAGDVGALDAATADSRYLPALSPSILRAHESTSACFLIARKADGTDDWYVGRGSDSSDNITLRSYILDTELMLRSASISINKPLLINGAFAYTSNNPPPSTRVWVSGEYTPVINTPTILNHGLVDIDPLRCSVDVLLKCVNPNNGYNVGDFAVGWGMHPSANAALSPMPVLNATQIQLNTGGYHTGIYLMPKASGSSAEAVLSDWRYVFRIFY
ncbi:phage tail protein [Pectobacterium sp. CHL-2024]|uniref:phage tail-collar fiber domain-containing protein n=1 Tax=Pectobacterium sp. CHL-2024 TaxID=3377079 RepID=UPI00380B5CD6